MFFVPNKNILKTAKFHFWEIFAKGYTLFYSQHYIELYAQIIASGAIT